MNMFKKNGGFTLVELIVVIAILAILAGVAVPAYTGYINKAEQAKDLQVLSSINTAVQGVAAAKGKTVESIKVDTTGITEIKPTDVTVAEVTAYTGTTFTWSKNFKGAEWTATKGEWTLK